MIPNHEYGQRIAALRGKMRSQGIDMAMAFSNLLDPSAVRYFCDFAAVNESAAIIVPADGQVTVCSGQASYDYAQVKNRLADSVIKIFPEIGEVSGFEYDTAGQLTFGDYFRELKEKYSVKKIAIMGRLTFPVVIYNALKSVFSQAEIIDFDDELYALRLIKSPAELKCMQRASDIITDTFKFATANISEGMTELAVQALFEGEMLRLGGESYVQAFAPMIATGPENSYISMSRNTTRKIGRGEIINIAAGACYEGYNGIICSPHVLGEVPSEMSSAFRCAYDALNAAADKMKPGNGAAEILNTYTDYLKKYGYIDYCPYGSLHSTGMLECEAPVFTVANNRLIEENMTICIDAYFKGMKWGSFRIEDVYVITSSGARRMTKYNDLIFGK